MANLQGVEHARPFLGGSFCELFVRHTAIACVPKEGRACAF